jgi:hypothetical protein
MTSLQDAAGTIAKIDEAAIKALPFISSVIGFVPGGAAATPFLPLIGEILQAVDNAAKHIQQGNTSAAFDDILVEIRNHLTPGAPNSSVLSSPPAPAANASPAAPSASTQGSG